QDWDSVWSSKLTPMTRLLLVAGLTSVGVSAVHFIDGNHASFTTPSSFESGVAGGVRGAGAGGGGGGGGNGGVGAPGSGSSRPLRGQVGVLRLDDYAYRNQFVLSSRQSLPDRLVSTGDKEPLRPWGAWDDKGGGNGGGGGAGGGGGRGWGSGKGGGTECVKFAGHVGSWGRKRDEWFQDEGDPREFLLAVDNFCPIPWLREEEEEEGAGAMEDDGDEDIGQGEAGAPEVAGKGRALGGVVVGGRGGEGLHGGRGYGGRPKQIKPEEHRKVIIYQRDRNRKLLQMQDV
ncbi:unnamed protein product, partial [Laminaria digitata]